MTTRVKQ